MYAMSLHAPLCVCVVHGMYAMCSHALDDGHVQANDSARVENRDVHAPDATARSGEEAKVTSASGKLAGGSQVSEDLEDEEAIEMLFQKARRLPGPFILASPSTPGDFHERKFVDWYIYQAGASGGLPSVFPILCSAPSLLV